MPNIFYGVKSKVTWYELSNMIRNAKMRVWTHTWAIVTSKVCPLVKSIQARGCRVSGVCSINAQLYFLHKFVHFGSFHFSTKQVIKMKEIHQFSNYIPHSTMFAIWMKYLLRLWFWRLFWVLKLCLLLSKIFRTLILYRLCKKFEFPVLWSRPYIGFFMTHKHF